MSVAQLEIKTRSEHPIYVLGQYTDCALMSVHRTASTLLMASLIAGVIRTKVSRGVAWTVFLAVVLISFIYDTVFIRTVNNMMVQKVNRDLLVFRTHARRPVKYYEDFRTHCVFIAYNGLLTFLYKYLFTGKTRSCHEMKKVAISTMVILSDSTYIYVPRDFTIPPHCIIVTNHAGYTAKSLECYPKNNSRDALGFFQYIRPDQQLYTLSHGSGKIADFMYNNYNVAKTNKGDRRGRFNHLCNLTKDHVVRSEPFSVVIFAMDHRSEVKSVYHHSGIFDGSVALALCTGAYVIPVFNAFFVDKDGREHFRQISGSPFLPLQLKGGLPYKEGFCLDGFRSMYPEHIRKAKLEMESRLTALSRQLSDLHDPNEYDTHWEI